MACYVIGIGGTGAKCVEALIHLCAAGLMPDTLNAQGQVVGKEDLYVAFVDADTSNGNLERARITLTQYDACRSPKLGAVDLFKTPILVARSEDGKARDTWSPFGDEDTPRPKLDTFFDYHSLSASPNEENKRIARLFDVLYSPQERTTTLEKGFRGHPSIGAAVLSSTVTFSGEPWKTLKDKIRQDIAGAGAKIIVIGSIFGGTGAAGVPTIGRLISNEFNLPFVENSWLGAVVVLPFFSFSPSEEEGIRADSENFLLNTQAALKYYHQQAVAGRKMALDVFDTMYTFGESQLSPVRISSLGSKLQRNEPHVIELYAALACLDFFEQTKQPGGYNMIARSRQDEIAWPDVPYTDNSMLTKKLRQLTRFAFAYFSSYHPAIKSLQKRGSYRAPWYVHLFERQNVRGDDGLVPAMRDYCETYLLWLANINWSSKNVKVKLADYKAFAEVVNDEKNRPKLELRKDFDLNRFDNLIPIEGNESQNGLHRLWEDMCIPFGRDKDARGSGKFFNALYQESGSH